MKNWSYLISQGFVDTSLTEIGEKQATAAGKFFQNELFHEAYSSTLKRAINTCELILAENKVSNISSQYIKQDERLKEQNFGKYENSRVEDWIKKSIEAKVEDPIDFCPESVEKTVDLRNRAREFLKSLISKVLMLYIQLFNHFFHIPYFLYTYTPSIHSCPQNIVATKRLIY